MKSTNELSWCGLILFLALAKLASITPWFYILGIAHSKSAKKSSHTYLITPYN
jgi:hypothetical protein